jgi:hypothetical protein
MLLSIWSFLSKKLNIQLGRQNARDNNIMIETVHVHRSPHSLPQTQKASSNNAFGRYVQSLVRHGRDCDSANNVGQNSDVWNNFEEFIFKPIKQKAEVDIIFERNYTPYTVEFRGRGHKGFEAYILYRDHLLNAEDIKSWETEQLDLTTICSRITFQNIVGREIFTQDKIVSFFTS